MKQGLRLLLIVLILAVIVTIFQGPIQAFTQKLLPHTAPHVNIHPPQTEAVINWDLPTVCIVPKKEDKTPAKTKALDETETLEAMIAALPENIRAELDGWTLCLASRETLQTLGFTNVLALTDSRTHTVYFREGSDLSQSFYHELGHVLAVNHDRCDLQVTCTLCYGEEKDSLIDVHEQGDRHCSLNPEEYFATIVDNIFCSGDTYEYSAPKGYAYVRQCLGL